METLWGWVSGVSAQSKSVQVPDKCIGMTQEAPVIECMKTYVSQAARVSLIASAHEQVEEVEAVIHGSIPSWLSGTFIQNGCGDYTDMGHIADGLCFVSRLRICDGRVWGSQRFLQSDTYKNFRSSGKLASREFSHLPITTGQGALASSLRIIKFLGSLAKKPSPMTDNASVNLVPLPDGNVLAVSESLTSLYRMDPNTLDTLEHVMYTDEVEGDLSTAHPKVMPDGTMINFSRSMPYGGFHVLKQDPHTLKRTEIAFIKDRHPLAPAWVHDMCLTSAHVVIVEPPLYFNIPSLMLSTEREFEFMDWQPKDGTQVHVVSLNNGTVRTFHAPAFFAFHYANAYESPCGKLLYVDMGVYDDPTIINRLKLAAFKAFPGAEVPNAPLCRLTIRLDTLSPESSQLQAPQPLMLDDSCYGKYFDFPALHPGHQGTSYRYVWGLAAARPTHIGNALAKHDLKAGTSLMWHEEGSMAAEATFLPKPGSVAEDDGVLLSIVMSNKGLSFLLVLNASNMLEIARAELPYAVPYRFHGGFLPKK